MSNSLFIIIIFLLVMIVGLIKGVNCYDSFMIGVKEGLNSVVNMFSVLLTFKVAISLMESSGIISFLTRNVNNSVVSLLIQVITRPFSSSSSLAIMLDIYEKNGVDSLMGIASTFVHSVCDTTFYIISFYYGYLKINKVGNAILFGVISNIIGFSLTFIVIYIFF